MQQAIDNGPRGREDLGQQIRGPLVVQGVGRPGQAVGLVARPLEFLRQPRLALLSWQGRDAVRLQQAQAGDVAVIITDAEQDHEDGE